MTTTDRLHHFFVHHHYIGLSLRWANFHQKAINNMLHDKSRYSKKNVYNLAFHTVEGEFS